MFGFENLLFEIKYLKKQLQPFSRRGEKKGGQNLQAGAPWPSDRAKVPPNVLLRPLSGRPALPPPVRFGGVVYPSGSPALRPAGQQAAGPTAPPCAMTGAA